MPFLVEMTLASFVLQLRVIIQLKDLNKAVKLIQDLHADAFYHGSWHISGTARVCPINDANTLDCVLKLAIDSYDTLDQAQQVSTLRKSPQQGWTEQEQSLLLACKPTISRCQCCASE
jgi:hypothetical protein